MLCYAMLCYAMLCNAMLCYEAAVSGEMIQQITDRPAVAAAMPLELPAKLVELGVAPAVPVPVRNFASTAAASVELGAGPRTEKLRAALRDEAHTQFSRRGDREVVLKMLNKFVADCTNAMVDAAGEFRDNADAYEGERGRDGERQGRGTARMSTGDMFDGQWRDGEREGHGKMSWRTSRKAGDEETFEGEWRRGQREGSGTFTHANGDVYTGEWAADIPEGEGKETKADGTVYEGEWRMGMFQGPGTMTYPNGDVYVGQWEESERAGKGTFTFVNGDTFEGDFVEDKHDGRGTFRFADGRAKVGTYRDAKPVGEGALWSTDRQWAWRLQDGKQGEEISLYAAREVAARVGLPVPSLPEGYKYEGEWDSNFYEPHGVGTFVHGDLHASPGAVYKGEWREGKRAGHGTYTTEFGVYTGQWAAGVQEGTGTYTHSCGRASVGWYVGGALTGDAVQWTATRQIAYWLFDGELQEEIPLDEARALAKQIGLSVPLSAAQEAEETLLLLNLRRARARALADPLVALVQDTVQQLLTAAVDAAVAAAATAAAESYEQGMGDEWEADDYDGTSGAVTDLAPPPLAPPPVLEPPPIFAPPTLGGRPLPPPLPPPPPATGLSPARPVDHGAPQLRGMAAPLPISQLLPPPEPAHIERRPTTAEAAERARRQEIVAAAEAARAAVAAEVSRAEVEAVVAAVLGRLGEEARQRAGEDAEQMEAFQARQKEAMARIEREAKEQYERNKAAAAAEARAQFWACAPQPTKPGTSPRRVCAHLIARLSATDPRFSRRGQPRGGGRGAGASRHGAGARRCGDGRDRAATRPADRLCRQAAARAPWPTVHAAQSPARRGRPEAGPCSTHRVRAHARVYRRRCAPRNLLRRRPSRRLHRRQLPRSARRSQQAPAWGGRRVSWRGGG